MEIFVWKVAPVICLEHQRRYPQENSQVVVKTPLFFPQPSENSLCLCQKTDCPIIIAGGCTRQATFIEIFSDIDTTVGIITPERQSVFKPRPVLSGI